MFQNLYTYIFFSELPYFTKQLPETTTTFTEHEVVFECETSAVTTVQWFKDTVEVPLGHTDYIIKTDGTSCILSIPKVSFDNEANYSAVIRLTKETTKTQLVVQGRNTGTIS